MDRNANPYSELFYHCVQVLNEYPATVSEEVFLAEYFAKNQVPNEPFVTTILFDCLRHAPLLRTINEIFYETDGVRVLRAEENFYKVIVYLVLFQLDIVGLKLLRGFIRSIEINRSYLFLKFFTNEQNIETMKKECAKLYEQQYVEEKVGLVMKNFLPDLREILLDLKDVLDRKNNNRTVPEPTKVEPFQLTAAKPRIVPIPKIIPKMEKSRPVPKTTYEPSREQTELEKIREENHEKIMKKFEETQQMNFGFLRTEKSSKTQEKLSKIIEDREKTLQFDHFRANPLPKAQSNKIPVKLNTAAILKESQLYKKQEERVRQRLMNYEAGGKDAQGFFQWQQNMQQQDYEEMMNSIERKRLEGKMSYEEAILARERLAEENRQIAEQMKQKARQAIDEHVKEKLREEQRMKQLIEEVVSGRENAKLSQHKLQQYKSDFVKQYKEEFKQMMKQALEEAEIEMRQRAELIQQIRALESTPVDRRKIVDLTSTPGHGVFDEMSIAELRERLELVKLERDKQRELKRDQIIREKQIKEDQITTTVQNLVKYRNEVTSQAAAAKKQRQISAPVRTASTAELQKLKENVEMKKAQRLNKQETFRKAHSSLSMSSVPSTGRQVSFRPDNPEWNRFNQLEKSSDKRQKKLAPLLLA